MAVVTDPVFKKESPVQGSIFMIIHITTNILNQP